MEIKGFKHLILQYTKHDLRNKCKLESTLKDNLKDKKTQDLLKFIQKIKLINRIM